MYLRSLELQGFKSFPDKTKLTFTKGISAVVGPNGSGKSNIGDAMRWVMGETSAKSLRGKSMDDVIFSGTNRRQKSSFAQVTLTIDNEDHALKNDADIVSVSRKVYRSGESEYQINGQKVRLKDIEELFMDTGLGKDGYSIIGQGRISEIVSSKADDRRQIFEEAAGISKFKSKKKETERELLRAEDNLSRLTDIVSELESRIGPLKKQCEKAKQFKLLDDEKSGLEVSLWVYRLGELMQTQKEHEERLRILSGEYTALSEQLDQLEKEIEDGFYRAAQHGSSAAKDRERIHEIELENTQSAAKTAVLKNDIEHLNEKISQMRENIEQSRSSGYFLKKQLDDKKEELSALMQEGERSAQSILQCEKELSGTQDEMNESESEVSKTSGRLGELYLKKSNAAFKLESAKNTSFSVTESLESLESDKQEQQQRRTLYEGESRRLKAQAEKNQAKKQEIENKLSGYQRLHESKSKKLAEARQSLSDNDMKISGIKQRLSILNDLENAMEGFAYSVKFMMKAAAQKRISGICGSIAQLITVKPEYSTAVETALGGALQNIAVENEDAAKRSIRLLKENNAGRATFLPLTSVRGRTLDDPPINEDGYIALGCELVECDEKYSGLIKSLLGRVAVAENIDCASNIAKRCGYKFKIVTLDGQVVNAGGSYTGGSTSKSTGILTRKNEIGDLNRSLEKLTAENGELKSGCERLSQEVQKFAAELEGQRSELNTLSGEILRNDMELKRIGELLSELEGSDEKIKETAEKLRRQLEEAERQTDEAAEELCSCEKEIADCEAQLSDSRERNAQLDRQRLELSERLSQLKIAEAGNAKDIEACENALRQISESIENGADDESRLEGQIIDCENEIKQKLDEIDKVNEAVSGSGDEIKRLEEQISRKLRLQADENISAEKLKTEQKHRMNERETLSSEITRLKERLSTVNAEFDKTAAQLWDDYGLTRSEAEESCKPPEDIKAARLRLNELKQQIKALGNVNLSAIEEYAEVSERYRFMTEQIEDVNKSKLELTELIDSLTEKMKTMFIESFNIISKQFSKIFTELFGGGTASLSLTDPDDVLECGIDIKVSPPGKVVKNLMSLSGGESSFVAVCIYFAILTVKPSPFCLLDEIEAALDDVNVAKYAAYLHRFTDKTQFITITHRRGTMEEADVLYGVTMQDEGVSRLLKMDMEDTKQMPLE